MINLLKNAAESGSAANAITVRAGRLSLANRPEGGAVVTVWLPNA